MSNWPATKARRVLAALLRAGWVVKRQSGSNRTLSHADRPDIVFAFHDDEELGPRILNRIAKRTGLTPSLGLLNLRSSQHVVVDVSRIIATN